jgi:hypothetical protein
MHKNHVFISYAHIDNLPLSPEQQGWISRFHHTFSVFLSQRMGGTAQIWRDQKLQGNDIFGDEIIKQFRDSALFISVLSPRYVRSSWCRREIAEFCNHAEADGGLTVNNKSRLLKVIKTPVDHEHGAENSLPAVAREILGYEFYVQDEQGCFDLDPDFGEIYKQNYLRKICLLANNASQLILHIESKPTTADPQPPSPFRPHSPARKSVVFLASCSFDQRDQREWIEADLRRHGYRVLPEEHLPIDHEQAHSDAIAPLLEQAHLSIHLIGSHYGAVPDGPSHHSVVEIQNSIASERSGRDGFKRLIWLPEGLSSTQPDQVRFLHSLANEAQAQRGADLLRGSLEQLRTVLHSTLERIENPWHPRTVEAVDPSTAAGLASPGGRMIYLICVEKDRSQTLPLRKWLKDQGYEVILPAFTGDAAALRETHEGLLRDCGGALIFYGTAEDVWHRSVARDLRRAPVYRDGRPLPPPLTFLAAPNSNDKDDMVAMEEPHLVDGREAFRPEALLPFLQRIREAGL